MENESDKINEELSNSSELGMSASTTSEEVILKSSAFGPVVNETILVRMVPEKWIRSNNTITSDAYRPKKKPYSDTGYEKNVSTSPKTCFKSNEDLAKHASLRRKHKLYEMAALHPNTRDYLCIQDKECHIGITGDMLKLVIDEETLEYFANSSQLLYPTT